MLTKQNTSFFARILPFLTKNVGGENVVKLGDRAVVYIYDGSKKILGSRLGNPSV